MYLQVYYVLLPILFSLASPIHDAAPYPPSPVIIDMEWAPKESIQRMANGSDTFPITWADDGSLYTAYGDGNGFEPLISDRLSLGFARVDGPPTNFSAENIRSNGEQTGHGSEGKKASGMLMVDSVLYMWVRNADNDGKKCQLAWSTDHAKTWTFSDWRFDEFGYCTFINYGQNYAGARDGYVYTVTHDNPSAYTAADQFILMRVPKAQMQDKSAYEYFVEVDGSGTAQWTADVEQRGSVFNHAELSLRSGISYIPGLKRYLWWQQLSYGSEDTRFEGGFGIYDAPEPWGPWTTVYYTHEWDVGPGETGSFPPKWASSDGKTLYLVFSGDDAFSVRKATLTLAKETDLANEPTPTALPQQVATSVPTTEPTSRPTPRATSTPIPTAEPPLTEPVATPPLTPPGESDPSESETYLGVHTMQARVAQSEDDAEEDESLGEVSLGSADLELSENRNSSQLVGIRFQNIHVPHNAQIIDAYIQFQSTAPNTQSTSLSIYGEDTFHARPFSLEPYDISSRNYTEAAVVWNDVPAWGAAEALYETPSLAPIVQEITAHEGWRSGNAMAFIFTGNGKRAATSYDGSPGMAPALVIDYRLPVYLPLVVR